MAILLKCSARKHTLRLNPKSFWRTTFCPECCVAVDPLRLRRAMKVPSLLFDKDFQLLPPLISRAVVPVLGFISLIVGITLTVLNWNSAPPEKDDRTDTVASEIATPDSSPSTGLTSVQPSTRPENSAFPFPINQNSTASTTETNSESTASLPTPSPETIRYETGTNLIRPEKTGGRSKLRISNGTTSDAIAKLVDTSSGRTVRLVYIQAGSVANVSAIASGFYTLKFSLGSEYDKENGKFLNSQSFSKFDDTLDCTVTKTSSGLTWTDHEVTLNPVLGGTARTSSISAADFEGIK